MRARPFLACIMVAGAASVSSAEPGDTTVPITGIGTSVGTDIATHVDSVTYSEPVVTNVPGIGAVTEVHGTISGVGWGGTGMVPRPAGHYAYTVTWHAMWHGSGKTLVHFHHGGPTPPLTVATVDCQQGVNNPHRYTQHAGDPSAGLATLIANGTYLATNRRGILENGRFSAKYLPPTAGLTQAEIDAQNLLLAPACGAGYHHPDLVLGGGVPVNVSTDVPTFRDIDRALAQVVSEISGNRYRERISTSNSAGTVLTTSMAFGCSPIAGACRRTGGNYAVPYDTSSPTIYDAFIFNGFVYDTAVPRADAAQPFSVPVMFLQGRGDERLPQPLRMANELLAKGVSLDGRLWIYEIANMPHVTRDTLLAIPADSGDGEAMGGYYLAAIVNMRDFLGGLSTPPPSRIGGRLENGSLVYDVAGGAGFTTSIPVVEDLDLDTVPPNIQITPRKLEQGIYAGVTDWWKATTAALPHASHIVGPTTACRVGRYTMRFFGDTLTPFLPDELAARYGSFHGYRACLDANIAGLAADRLYDPRFETARELAERARAFFN